MLFILTIQKNWYVIYFIMQITKWNISFTFQYKIMLHLPKCNRSSLVRSTDWLGSPCSAYWPPLSTFSNFYWYLYTLQNIKAQLTTNRCKFSKVLCHSIVCVCVQIREFILCIINLWMTLCKYHFFLNHNVESGEIIQMFHKTMLILRITAKDVHLFKTEGSVMRYLWFEFIYIVFNFNSFS